MTWGYIGAAVIVGVAGYVSSKKSSEGIKDAANTQAAATQSAIASQSNAAIAGQSFLEPFAGLGQQGLDQAEFLTDPQKQFEFLQNNPLFDLSLANANRQTQNVAASRGRLSSGDTLEQLGNNVLLSSQPLIADQKRSIQDLLNAGIGVAQTQGNIAIGEGSNIAGLLTNQGNADAAGIIGAANARAQGINAAGTAVASATPLLVNKFTGNTT